MEFSYQAKDNKGRTIEGIVEAPSKDQAITALHRKSLIVIALEQVESKLFTKDLGSFLAKPRKKDIVIFTRQLATLIDADIPLLEALHVLTEQTERASLKKIVEKIAVSVEGGSSLSLALAEHKDVFDDFYINIIKVGEVSGKLQDALLYLADYMERSAALTSKIKGALYYPVFVLVALVVVVVIMMTSVVPQLLSIVKESGVEELPLTTRILIAVTDFVNNYLLFLIFLIIILAVFGYYYFTTEKGRIRFDRMKISMPQFGKIAKNLYIARMAETLATLIKSGVPILEGISITAKVVGNRVYQGILEEAEGNVRGGGTISEVLAQHEEVPKLVSSMLSTGEKTGRIDYMLGNVLKFYEGEAEESIKNLSQLIEPILILILGVGVGGLVAAILLPIYSLIGAV